ncbi:hypothetical protein ONZ51_g3830 [Trametes cubensis]|uniref:RNA-dependent RNA polymerase n=1 Tax=Trametes cubensis TaxID=1111947 RepID=A0AAD7TWZ0_9APHY|nr:hypothetical protein ONZ51_g3830 [Trametes cubensis]
MAYEQDDGGLNIPLRTASQHSLSSQSTRYSELLDEDISELFHAVDDDLEQSYDQYRVADAPQGFHDVAETIGKRKRSKEAEPEDQPPRRVLRTTTQASSPRPQSGSSHETVPTTSSAQGQSSSPARLITEADSHAEARSRRFGPAPSGLPTNQAKKHSPRSTKPLGPTQSALTSSASADYTHVTSGSIGSNDWALPDPLQPVQPGCVSPVGPAHSSPATRTSSAPRALRSSASSHVLQFFDETAPRQLDGLHVTPAHTFGPAAAAVSSGSTVNTAATTLSGPSSATNSPEAPQGTTVQPNFLMPEGWQPPEPVIIGHAGKWQSTINGLPWGAQWEFARYINMGFKAESLDWGILLDAHLVNKNAEAAPEVTKIIERYTKAAKDATERGEGAEDPFAAAYEREQSVKLPWEELDREEDILSKYLYGAIGCNEDQELLAQDPDWYGGRIHFTAQLHKDKGNDDFRFVLDRPELGSSNRFARRFGSRRFIRVRVHKDLLRNAKELREYFKQPFIIGGAVFRAFYAKEQNVFLFRTNERVVTRDKGVLSVCSPPTRNARKDFSLMDFLNWHNNLELNSEQTIVKWAARFALGLSNSVPGIRVQPMHVLFEDEIICDSFRGPGKPPSEMEMTDGCGFANRAVMRALKAKFPAWQEEPTAIQCRIGGAKGLLLVRHGLSNEQEEHPTVWLRPSQLKIKYTPHPLKEQILPSDADPAWLTIDVLRASRMNTPIRLSVETITNLAENGVPFSRFQSLFQVDLEGRVDPLLKYDTPGDMIFLWHAIAREGRVINSRMAREAVGIARAAGYVMEDNDDELEDEDEDGLNGLDEALKEQSSAWWEDPVSGQPSSLEETCLTLLDSGFTPKTCSVLEAKLREVARKVVTTFQSKYRFIVPMSCSAFIVPDPFGVLGPNEIHVKCSRRAFVDVEGRSTDIVIGDVLVTRHPCKVPTDVQKVKAVFHARLRHYCDVIVVSTQSHMYKGRSLDRHLASLTGGGDYDGDTMQVFWDPNIVNSFREPDPEVSATEPPTVKACLVKDSTSVSTFLDAMRSAPEEYKVFALQEYLLGALRGDFHVSTYSTWWEKSTYTQGYSHPETVFLAYMFCAALDGLKTGVSVSPASFAEHRKRWQPGVLAWKAQDEKSKDKRYKGEQYKSYNVKFLKRKVSSSFIMDILQKLVKDACDAQLGRIERQLGSGKDHPGACRRCKEDQVLCDSCDRDLAAPWLNARQRALQLRADGKGDMWDELVRIETHVQAMHQAAMDRKRSTSFRAGGSGEYDAGGNPVKTGGKESAPFTRLPIEKRQDILREQSKRFHAEPRDLRYFDDPTTIKASCAYFYDHRVKGWDRFPWDVATRALCEIKAKATGSSKTLSGDFYRWMAVSPVYLRHHMPKT